MPNVRVVQLPALLSDADVVGRTVVVFDVLRATSSMAHALHAGVTEIRVFGALDAAQAAHAAFDGPKLLAGETKTRKPPGFDLGNSPAKFDAATCDGKTLFMCTTNGTVALIAARKAARLMIGSLVSAHATALVAARLGEPVTLLCSGTEGQPSMEDLLGCGAVLARLPEATLENDSAQIAKRLWLINREPAALAEAFAATQSSRNLHAAELEADIADTLKTDALPVVGIVEDRGGQLVVTRAAT